MKTIQFAKIVNNTELGKANTHETYLLVPKEVNAFDLFDGIDTVNEFIDKLNGEKRQIRIRTYDNAETRIIGLGQFYADNGVEAGDSISIEKNIIGSDSFRYISVQKKNNRFIFQKIKGYFEIPENHLSLLDGKYILYKGELKEFHFHFEKSEKKRKDSPNFTNLYSLFVEDENVNNEFGNSDTYMLTVIGDTAVLSIVETWTKSVINSED